MTEASMLIRNVHIENSTEASDVRVTDNRIEEIGIGLAARAGETIVDGHGGVAIPRSSTRTSTSTRP